jgi:AcrR family transcriptional regulator
MTSTSNKPHGITARGNRARGNRARGNPVAGRTEEDTLLDAARACVLAVGLRRTTLTDVARRAGVSRMTIYRRWPDMGALMADLMTREWGEITRAAMAAAGGPPPGVEPGDAPAPGGPISRDGDATGRPTGSDGDAGSARRRFVTAVVAAGRALRHHPVFRRILELDPEILLPYLIDRRGRSQDQMLTMMTAAIAGATDGSVRAGDPGLLARSVLLTVQGFVLSLPTMADSAGESDLDEQLRVMLDRFLAP